MHASQVGCENLMTEMEMDEPPIQLAIRHKNAWELLMLDKNEHFHSVAELDPCNFLRYSPDGCFLICVKQEEGVVEIFDTNPDNIRCVMQFEHPGVRSASLSPKNSFLLSYNRRRKEDKEGNLVVWSIETQSPVLRIFITPPEVFDPDEPPIRWSGDETLVFRKTKSGILVCDGADPTKTLTKIEQTRIEQWSVSPRKANLAIFIPEHKKSRKPGCVVAYRGESRSFECVASSTFYNAEEVDFEWNSTSDCVLCVASDEIDQTGSSYYGAKRLYLLNVLFGISSRIPIAEGAPLQATGWLANGKDFIAVHDHPFRADVWRATKKGCVENHQFEHNTYNNTLGSPDGRFLCLCGFGNLPGHMYFWDYETKTHLGHAQYSSATNYIWAPNGRFFLTSRLHPTRRVENGWVLWDYCGNKVDEKEYGELYETKFRPCSQGTYKSRPPSPTRKGTLFQKAALEQGQYVPPHMRGKVKRHEDILHNSSPTKRKKKKSKPKVQSDPVQHLRAPQVHQPPPGLQVQQPPPGLQVHQPPPGLQQQQPVPPQAASAAETFSPPVVDEPVDPYFVDPSWLDELKQSDDMNPQKQVRKLNKKLKQIEVLKAKVTRGEELNADQHKKIAQEDELKTELATLLVDIVEEASDPGPTAI